ncbi:hypothetical protein HanOQP8_Chr10g0358451 [Helianthus annuus]|nr:hypothetical protein HanOQP8_Chr10g0358451 [Helianthus annuus]
MLVVFRQTTRETSSLTDPPPMNISNGSAGKQLGPAVGVSTRRSETRSGGQRQGPAVLVFIRQASPYVDSDVVQILGQIRVRNSGLGSDRVRFGQNGQFQMWFESTRSTELTRSTQTMRVNSARCESTQRVRVRRFGSRLLFTCSDQVQQGQWFGPGQAASGQSSWNSSVRVRRSQTEPTWVKPGQLSRSTQSNCGSTQLY